MYACVCYSSLLECIKVYRLYKQIDHSTGVPGLTPGYGNVTTWLLLDWEYTELRNFKIDLFLSQGSERMCKDK